MKDIWIILALIVLCCGHAFAGDREYLEENIELVFVEGKTFEYKNKTVTVNSFYISKYEVTQTLYEYVMWNNPSFYRNQNNPVEGVSWYDAVEFCNAVSLMQGLRPCYRINKFVKDENVSNDQDYYKWKVTCDWNANGYRLPTEAEWEYAAKGGKESLGYKYCGSDKPGDVSWFSGNSKNGPHEVGMKRPNELDLYDMSGNVYEWCWDWYGLTLEWDNPTGPSSGGCRVLRGGAWNCRPLECEASYRYSAYPNDKDAFSSTYGIRLVRGR